MQVDYLRGLITLESLIVICLVVSYILVLREFHAAAQPPDVLRQELTGPLLGTEDLVGCVEPAQLAEVLERQAEMIRSTRGLRISSTLVFVLQVFTRAL